MTPIDDLVLELDGIMAKIPEVASEASLTDAEKDYFGRLYDMLLLLQESLQETQKKAGYR